MIFGSTALKYWFDDFGREPKDLDIIGKGKSNSKIEFHCNNAFEYILEKNKDKKYVDPNFLYTIKCSHLQYDINWDKHCMDAMFMESKGCKVDDDLYDLLIKDWIKIHGKKKLNLKQDPKDFFNSYVKREMDHDELHEKLAYYENPMFRKILKDEKSVLTDKNKWINLSHEQKLICILEESYVTAFERWKQFPSKMLKMKGIKLYCTSLSKNDYYKYAVLNLKQLFDHHANSYFQKKIDLLKRNLK